MYNFVRIHLSMLHMTVSCCVFLEHSKYINQIVSEVMSVFELVSFFVLKYLYSNDHCSLSVLYKWV